MCSYLCPVCQTELNTHVEYLRRAPTPRVYDISLCGHCRAVLELTTEGWRQMSVGDFRRLPAQNRRAILHAAILLGAAEEEGATALQFAQPQTTH